MEAHMVYPPPISLSPQSPTSLEEGAAHSLLVATTM
jgi:hypothetical protein